MVNERRKKNLDKEREVSTLMSLDVTDLYCLPFICELFR